jgi:hypothetical protein
MDKFFFKQGWKNLQCRVYYPSFIEGNETQIDTINGPYQVIAFGHGFAAQSSYYISQFSHLATHGFIIIAPQFPDVNHQQLAYDLIYCINFIKAQGSIPSSRFYTLVDTTVSGVSGHSMGGGASLLAAAYDSTISGAAPLAAAETNPSAIGIMSQIKGAVYLISAQNDGITPINGHQLPMYNNADPVKGIPIIKRGNHTKFMDTRLFDWTDPNGNLPASEQLRLTRKYLTSFFKYILKSDTSYFHYAFGDLVQSDTSVIFNYQLKPMQPYSFNAISPSDTVSQNEVLFIWNRTYTLNLYDSLEYEVLISSDSSFNGLLHGSAALTDTLYSYNLPDGEYYWKVRASSSLTDYSYSNTKHFVVSTLTAIETTDNAAGFALSQNYPNPFNPSTTITYQLPAESNVLIKIFDALGREIEILLNEKKEKGNYSLTWHALGKSAGMYFYRIETDGYSYTKKMVLVK